MKKLTTILALMLVCMTSFAQTKTVLTTGTNGYVTVTLPAQMPQDFTRGTLQAQFRVRGTGDTVMSIQYTNGLNFTPLTQEMNDTLYGNGDASSAAFPTKDSLTHWVHNHLNKYQGN